MNIKAGGRRFKQQRTRLGMTLEDVEKLSSGKVTQVAGSRLENAMFARPAYELVTTYGTLLGMTPNEIARAFQKWVPEDAADYEDDPRVSFIRATLREMKEPDRGEMLDYIVGMLKAKLARNHDRS